MNQALITNLNLCDECGFARVILDGIKGAYFIRCAGIIDDQSCPAQTATFKTPEQAQTAWNKNNTGEWDTQPVSQKSTLLIKRFNPNIIVVSGTQKQNCLHFPYELIKKYGLEKLNYYYAHIVPGKPLAKIYFSNDKTYNKLHYIRRKKAEIIRIKINSTILTRKMDIHTIPKDFEIWHYFDPEENCFRLSFALLKELQGKYIPFTEPPKKEKPIIQSKPEPVLQQSRWADV